ncbi:hypothetical protein CDAR_30751 [Caerostris darwini]|uniref:Cyclin B n=1 Tax=Caerostris darwini TaxID=1538125 RepID=A0AAV4WB07_9ARAC|nr:hypothetical protein CDAR_30751 [Caerostris darwini]
MQTITNQENENLICIKRPLRNAVVRKPLRGLENASKNAVTKVPLKEKSQNVMLKESFKIKDSIKENARAREKENRTKITLKEKENIKVKNSFKEKDVKTRIAVKEKDGVAAKNVGEEKSKLKVDKEKDTIKVKTFLKVKDQDIKVLEDVKAEEFLNIQEIKNALPAIDTLSPIKIPDNVERIDEDDYENPQLVSCYINEIYIYLRYSETLFPIHYHFLDIQPEVTPKMRAILVDWIVQVHVRFHLLPETLFMTISIIDRFLQVDEVKRTFLQLVGVTALFIASKYEEMYAPDISDFVFITDNTYTKSDILNMEKLILKNLDFNLSKPLPIQFLRRASKAGSVEPEVHALAKYFLELSQLDYELVHYFPSTLAAASLFLSLKLTTKNPWSETLIFYSGYTEDDVLPVVKRLCKIIKDVELSNLQAIPAKYSNGKLLRVSTLPELKSSIVHDYAKLTLKKN